MTLKHLTRLHWKLYLPSIGLLWLIIGITICYFISHEQNRMRRSLQSRLLNVNITVIDAYDRGLDLQETVDFVRLFTDDTTLDPLRITVYDNEGRMLADNPEATINLYDKNGQLNHELMAVMRDTANVTCDLEYNGEVSMVGSLMSSDGKVYSLAALPYEGKVMDMLRIDPIVWILVIGLGLVTSVLVFFAVRAVCRNVYSLRDFAEAIASDHMPENLDQWHFSNDELGEVSRNLLALYREKLNAEQEKSHHEHQIIMNINHELNTPVGIIKGYIDSVLSDPEMTEDIKRHFLMRIQDNADRLAGLVSDISILMRLDEKNSLNCTPINLHTLAARVAEDLHQSNLANGMKFTYDIPADCMVMGHESLLTNALLNLMYNAVKYSGGTEVTFRLVGKEYGNYVFTFADDGCGVSPEHIGRLFDLFYRVDTGRTRKKGGTGLGLPLVQRIIRAMGGEIEVDNAPGGGLCFTFSLPAANNPAPAAD